MEQKNLTKETTTPSKHAEHIQWMIIAILLILVTAIGVGARYGYDYLINLSQRDVVLTQRIADLSLQIDFLESKLASTTLVLEGNITDTKNLFSSALQEEKQNVSSIKEQIGTFKEEVGEISGTVTTLKKLSKTDPELLQKYSKVFFLNEHYSPPQLAEINNQYKYSENKTLQIHVSVLPYLQNMLNDASGVGVNIFVFSAFRSFNSQGVIKDQFTVVYGEGTANQFSADQGYSEHQLGTTVDLITKGISGTLTGFEKTEAYTWLLNNAYKYGFVLSYPENNSFYLFEPWHWRFVGVELATKLHNTNNYFYNLNQREIDEYLVSIFD